MKIPHKSGRWILAVVIIVALYLFLSGGDGLINLYQQHRKVNAMKYEIENLNYRIDSLKMIIKKLKNDTAYIEKIAREKLGMSKKNETVYKLKEDNE